MRIALAAAMITALALTGCRSEEQEREALRAEALSKCKSSTAQNPNLDSNLFCECLVGKIVEGKSMDELRKMEEDKAGSVRIGQEAGLQCASQAMGAAPPQAVEAAPAAEAE